MIIRDELITHAFSDRKTITVEKKWNPNNIIITLLYYLSITANFILDDFGEIRFNLSFPNFCRYNFARSRLSSAA
jgi:hypothetical protein